MRAVAATGATFIVSPNCDTRVIAASKAAGLGSYPGVFTPGRCFAALAAGADAEDLPRRPDGPGRYAIPRRPAGWRSMPWAGSGPDDFATWRAAAPTGFGLGGSLFQPGWPIGSASRPPPARRRRHSAAFRQLSRGARLRTFDPRPSTTAVTPARRFRSPTGLAPLREGLYDDYIIVM